MFAATCPFSIILREELRHPMTIVFQFISDPTPCRNTCKFLRQCFEEAVRAEFLSSCQQEEELQLTTSFPRSGNRIVIRDILSSAILLSTPFTTLPIRSLELVDLPSLQAIDHDLLQGSRTLTQLTLARLPQLTVIGEKFAAQCPNLENCFISDLPQLHEVHHQMFFQSGLRHLWVENLPQLRTIGRQALVEAPRLRTIRFQNLKSLKTIGSEFARGCSVLERIRLVALPRLERISSHFGEDTALLQIEIEELPRLQHIGSHFATNCAVLTHVTFRELPELKTIEANALENCPVLEKVYFSNLPLLTELCTKEHPFASACPKLRTLDRGIVIGRRKAYSREIIDRSLQASGEPLSMNFSRVIQWHDGQLNFCASHLAKRPVVPKTDRTRAAGLGFNSRHLPGGSLVVEDNIVSTLPPQVGRHRRAGAVDDTGCGCSLM